LTLVPCDGLLELCLRLGKDGGQLLKGCVSIGRPERGPGVERGDALDALLEDASRGADSVLNLGAVIGFIFIEAAGNIGGEDAQKSSCLRRGALCNAPEFFGKILILTLFSSNAALAASSSARLSESSIFVSIA
jgi:hypothetical protein